MLIEALADMLGRVAAELPGQGPEKVRQQVALVNAVLVEVRGRLGGAV